MEMSEAGEKEEKLKADETVLFLDIDDCQLDDRGLSRVNESPSVSIEEFRGFNCDQVKNLFGFENVQPVPKKHKFYNSVGEYKIFPAKGKKSKLPKNETSHNFHSEVKKRGSDTVNDFDNVGETVANSLPADTYLKCPMCEHVSTSLSDLDCHILSHNGKALYSCSHCDKRFTSDKYLREHSLDHRVTRVYQCAECEFVTTARGTFHTHALIHIDVRPHKCSFCGKCFRTHSHLKNHKRRHTGEKPYSCTKCDYRARGINALKAHMLTKVHSDNKPFKCSICSASFSSRRNLQSHMISHSDKRPFSCSSCGKGFKTKRSLETHSILHKSDYYYCSYCEFRSKHKVGVKLHERTHTGDRSHRKFECQLCGLRTDKKGLKNHMPTHGEDRAYLCGRCDYRAKTKCSLAAHEKTHTGCFVTCSVCQKTYTTKKSLKCHFLKFHTKERPFKCSLCDFAAVEKRRLETHIMKHTGETPYRCEICSVGFSTTSYLGRHRRTVHSEVELTKCPLCDHRTKYKGNLKIHMRQKHNKERLFKCDVCPQTFNGKNAFVAHKVQHSGLRPYKCHLCTYAGIEERSLKAHIAAHRNNGRPAKWVWGSDLKCSVCPFLARGKVNFRKHLLLHVKTSCVKLHRLPM